MRLLSVLLFLPLTAFAASNAVYTNLQPDEFMTRWLVLQPIPTTESQQKEAFAADQLDAQTIHPAPGAKQSIGGKELAWTLLESDDDTVNLQPSDYSIAYAWAEIDMPETTKALFGLGSDDGIKVWLNGKLVYQHWASRSTNPDDDIAPVEFHRGANQLLLKIQNIKGDWSFACRMMGPGSRADKLISSAFDVGSDQVKTLLDTGLVDVNAIESEMGISAVHAARLVGNTDLVDYLVSRGADLKIGLPVPEKLVGVLMDDAIDDDEPGAAILVARGGKILFEKGYGLADVERHIPITPQTCFHIGSITKQFISAAILKLQEQGQLSVTDKLAKYLPDFPRAAEITLYQLLTHTSGLPSYTERKGFKEEEAVSQPITLGDLIQLFRDDPFKFDPGKDSFYSNSGYTLLAAVIGKVTGGSYADYLRENFFEPLGMRSTSAYHGAAPADNEALGYMVHEDGRITRVPAWNLSRVAGAGDIVSTVGDLFRWNEALFNGKVLSEASLKAAFTPVKTAADPGSHVTGYGLGFTIGMLRDTTEIDHGGSLPGFLSFLMRVPSENFTVVVLSNAKPGKADANPDTLARTTTQFYLGDHLAPLNTHKVNPAVSSKSFAALAGDYDYHGSTLHVTVEGGRVYAQLTNQSRFEIFPETETDFFWKVADAQVSFVKDANGKVIKVIHHQNGSTFSAPRIEP